MTPERTKLVNGRIIEEFIWNGAITIYIDNQLFDGSFEMAVREAEQGLKRIEKKEGNKSEH
jgi:hypothetical protein